MTQSYSRAELVVAAHRIIALGSRSFALASRLFARPIRERVWLLYAWCRAADDIADGQEMGMGRSPVADPQAGLALIRERTAAVLGHKSTGDVAFDALGMVVRECAIPPSLVDDVIAGFALDADSFQPADEDALLAYCYHVAGAIGVMMAIVMGVDPHDDITLDRACDLGIAFQLSNIARDIEEDAAAGRCYLPTAWLAELEVPVGAIGSPSAREALAVITGRLAELAGRYEASALVGAEKLGWRSRWAVLSAAGIYGAIGRKVAAAGAEALHMRVTTSRWEKLREVVLAFRSTVRGVPPQPRGDLWTRPRFT